MLLPAAVSPESDIVAAIVNVPCDSDALECPGYRRRITEGDLFRSPDPKNAPCDENGNSIESCMTGTLDVWIDEWLC